jgi:hypothetical protein
MESSSERQRGAGKRPALAELELAELEPKHHLVKPDLTGSLEAVALVEGDLAERRRSAISAPESSIGLTNQLDQRRGRRLH